MVATPLTAESTAATVFIVDDDAGTRKMTAKLIGARGLVANCFASGKEFLDGYDHAKPGCIVLDYQMPGMTGVEVQHALNLGSVHAPIIFVTGQGDVSFAAQAFRAGAFDVIPKPIEPAAFLYRVDEAVQVDLANHKKRAAAADVRSREALLTHRERQVAALLAFGESSKEIAHRLTISHKTADNHRAVILEKMGVDNPTQLAYLLAMLE